MAVITGDELSLATQKYVLDQPLHLGESVAPLIDLAVRSGVIDLRTGGVAKIPLRLDLEPMQTLAMYGTATPPSNNRNASVSVNFYRSIVPVEFDAMEAGNRLVDEVKIAVEKAGEGAGDLLQGVAKAMHQSNWNGKTDAAPLLTFRNAFPYSDGWDFFGLTVSDAPNFQHMYANTATAEPNVFGAGYKVTNFSDQDTGMLATVRRAKMHAASYGASKFVAHVTKEFYDMLYQYIESINAVQAVSTTPPAWLPKSGDQQGIRVGEVGYPVIDYQGILFIHDPFVDSTYYDIIMYPLQVMMRKNLMILGNKDVVSNEMRASKDSAGSKLLFTNNWTQKENSFVKQLIVGMRAQIILLHHPSVFVGQFDGTF